MEVKQGEVTIVTETNILGWDEELDPELFKLEIPPGYTETKG